MNKQTLGFASLALLLGAVPGLTGAADPNTASPDEVIAKVHEAAQYLHDKGQAGFPDFNNNARWVWKDSYVFVYSCRDNRMIAHPLRPDLVGKPVLQMQDEKGNLLFQKLCEAGRNTNGGWVEYWWPRPGEGRASRKISYALSTEVSFQSGIQVSAGIYDDTMSVENLNKLAQQALVPQKDAP